MTGQDQPENIYEALLRISLAINARLDLKEVLDCVIEHTRGLLGCEDASIILWDTRRGEFETGASTTRIGDTVAVRVRQQGGATRWIVDHGEPCIVPDTRRDPFMANPIIPENGIWAYAGVPIRQGHETLGVLYALSRRLRDFSAQDIEWMSELAGLAAIAIQNARLMSSLRELNEFKDALLRLAAHDLRQPLAPAIGFLDLVLSDPDPLPPEKEQWLGEVRKALIRMRDLIAAILDYERVSTEGDLKRDSLDLNQLVKEATQTWMASAREKSQDVTVELSDDPIPVEGNLVLLRQALNNLLTNASKYTPAQGHIAVRATSNEQEGAIEVQDDGPGIAADDLPRLFQPFVRLASAARTSGTGLGLSLVRKIVERHGGHVSVASELKKGSVFRLHLPRLKTNPSPDRLPSPPLSV